MSAVEDRGRLGVVAERRFSFWCESVRETEGERAELFQQLFSGGLRHAARASVMDERSHAMRATPRARAHTRIRRHAAGTPLPPSQRHDQTQALCSPCSRRVAGEHVTCFERWQAAGLMFNCMFAAWLLRCCSSSAKRSHSQNLLSFILLLFYCCFLKMSNLSKFTERTLNFLFVLSSFFHK